MSSPFFIFSVFYTIYRVLSQRTIMIIPRYF
nr:MAG TPA: hypothetical protein [Caudoviricetes sp.]